MILVLYTTHGRGDEEHEIHTAALGGHFYRPQMKLRKGNVFRPVCQSFCSHGGGLPQCTPLGRHPPGRHPQVDTPPGQTCPPAQCMLGYTPPRQTSPADTPRQTHPLGRHAPLPSACWDTRPLPSACCDSHGYCCRWYASYWNAFLFYDLFYSTKWTPPRQTHPPWADMPPCPVHAGIHTHPLPSACWDSHGYCCGRYASYWNAFLFYDLFYSTKWAWPHCPLPLPPAPTLKTHKKKMLCQSMHLLTVHHYY